MKSTNQKRRDRIYMIWSIILLASIPPFVYFGLLIQCASCR